MVEKTKATFINKAVAFFKLAIKIRVWYNAVLVRIDEIKQESYFISMVDFLAFGQNRFQNFVIHDQDMVKIIKIAFLKWPGLLPCDINSMPGGSADGPVIGW